MKSIVIFVCFLLSLACADVINDERLSTQEFKTIKAHVKGLLASPAFAQLDQVEVAAFGNQTLSHIEAIDATIQAATYRARSRFGGSVYGEEKKGLAKFFDKIKRALEKLKIKLKLGKQIGNFNTFVAEQDAFATQADETPLSDRQVAVFEKLLNRVASTRSADKVEKALKKMQPSLVKLYGKAVQSEETRAKLKAIFGQAEATGRVKTMQTLVSNSISAQDRDTILKSVESYEVNTRSRAVRHHGGDAAVGSVALILFFVIAVALAGAGIFIPLIVFGIFIIWYIIVIIILLAALSSKPRYLM